VNIDYSKYNRMNVQYNLPAHVGVNLATFLLPGKIGKMARAAQSAKIAAGAGAGTKAALAAKLGSTATAAKLGAGAGLTKAGLAGAGTKATIAGAGVGVGGGVAEWATDDPVPELDFEDTEDFYDASLYRYLPSGIK
jgi:hypothetical protein